MIGIIDYGMGNLYSVKKALERLDVPYFVSGHTGELAKADGLILPGVGAFRDAMNLIRENGQFEFIEHWAADGRPLLGICLGMQLLFEGSDEHGETEGFGFLPGHARRFSGKDSQGRRLKVPHMGWNSLTFHQPDHPLLKNVEEGHAYFVHSYVIETADPDVLLATSDYGETVPAVVGRGEIMGTQFHPEKSSTVGIGMLENFGAIVRERSGAHE